MQHIYFNSQVNRSENVRKVETGIGGLDVQDNWAIIRNNNNIKKKICVRRLQVEAVELSFGLGILGSCTRNFGYSL